MQHANTTATRSQSSLAGTEPAEPAGEPPEASRRPTTTETTAWPGDADPPHTAAEAVARAPNTFDTTCTHRIPNTVDRANQAMPDTGE